MAHHQQAQTHSSAGQAGIGGEQGLNGQWYEGGQFMPASALAVKGKHKASSGSPSYGRKAPLHLVEPGVKAEVPAGHRAIYQAIMLLVDTEAGALVPNSAAQSVEADDLWEYHPVDSMNHLHALIDAYHAGERFSVR